MKTNWYYSFHADSGSFSIFQTDEYDGRGGYSSREKAVECAKEFAMTYMEKIVERICKNNEELSYATTQLQKLNKGIKKLK